MFRGLFLCECLFGSAVVDRVFAEFREQPVRNNFAQRIDDECSQSDSKSDRPLLSVESIFVAMKHAVSESGDQDLTSNNNKPEDNEGSIGEEAVENIPLIVNFPTANHVEYLHKHESSKDEGEMARCAKLILHFFSE